MDGATRAAGAVAALRGFISPVRVARGVMEKTSHVLLVGDGACAFARDEGFDKLMTPPPIMWRRRAACRGAGTIGAVALDTNGKLAAATSTGGLQGKMPGRVGDTPIIGAGCWAMSARRFRAPGSENISCA